MQAMETYDMLSANQRRLAALYRGQGLAHVRGASPRVVIVGAGLAGLAAARLLDLAGCTTAVFDAASRCGGRIRTEQRQGALYELGGEFVDSTHDDIHAIASAFDLEVLDTHPPSENAYSRRTRFGGCDRSEQEVYATLKSVAPRIAADARLVGKRPTWRRCDPTALRFDHMSIAEYVGSLEIPEWLRQYIEVAYVTLYGVEAGQQSALNLLTLIGTDAAGSFELLGSSDERYKMAKGSQSLTDALALALESRINLDRQLVRLRRGSNSGWMLTFASDTAATTEVLADAVILALPFRLLREVDLGDTMPARKQQAIDELGYGRSSKLMLAMQGRPWRDQGCSGGSYTDTALQSSWDCSRLRDGVTGVFTIFLGGREADALATGTEESLAQRFLLLADDLYPGMSDRWNGGVRRIHWPSERWAGGGYSCYAPGQWTSFGGVEAAPVRGGLYFAGEHVSSVSQGYMDGAAETGRRAALAILENCR